jgi:hypothetical protein
MVEEVIDKGQRLDILVNQEESPPQPEESPLPTNNGSGFTRIEGDPLTCEYDEHGV